MMNNIWYLITFLSVSISILFIITSIAAFIDYLISNNKNNKY